MSIMIFHLVAYLHIYHDGCYGNFCFPPNVIIKFFHSNFFLGFPHTEMYLLLFMFNVFVVPLSLEVPEAETTDGCC